MNYYTAILSLIAFISCLFAIKSRQPIYYWLLAILGITAINETFLVYFLWVQFKVHKNIIYNLFSLIDILVWTTTFFIIYHKKRFRFVVMATGLLCFWLSLLEIFAFKDIKHLHTESLRFYNLCIIGFCIRYFFNVLKDTYHILTTDPVFWICVACFFYHSILFINFTTISRPDYWGIQNAATFFHILHFIGNAFYYLLLSCACFITYYKYKSLKNPTAQT